MPDRAISFFELPGETVWGATAAPRLVPRSSHCIALTPGGGRYHFPFRRDREPTQGVEVEIGIGKSGRRAYGFDDIAIVPSRRTRDPEDVDISWELDAFRFELPLMAAAMDGVISPATAIEIGRLGGLACLNLEGLWTRYEDPEPLFEEIAELRARQGHAPDAGDLRRAHQRGADRRAHPRDQGRRGHRVRLADAAAGRALRQARPRRRARHPRHPGHGRVRRARLQDRPSRST